jgi:two-component system response regulator DevR
MVRLLRDVDGVEVVGEDGTVAQALSRIRAARPDVAVLDARLPDGNGIELCRQVRSELPDTYCLMLSAYADEDSLLSAILAGASGYLLKEVSAGALVDAIRQAALGRSMNDPLLIAAMVERVRSGSPNDRRLAGISRREREVLELIADGLTNRQIGDQLALSEKTVRNYVSSLLGKLGLQRRTQAAVLGADIRAARLRRDDRYTSSDPQTRNGKATTSASRPASRVAV